MTALFFLVVLLAPPDHQKSLTVVSGTVILQDGSEVKIGPGTFVPAPRDASLAKKIAGKNAEIKILEEKLGKCEQRQGRLEDHWIGVEELLRGENKKLELKVIALNSFWSRWGKTLMWCAITAAGAAYITWQIRGELAD